MTYARGEESVPVHATVGRTQYETDDGHAVRVDFTDRDFLILAADLILAEEAATPKTGDQIREPQEGRTLVFEVTNWRYRLLR